MSDRNDNINEFDLMMKSILDEGREDVPAHVWEGISDGLDKAARRRTAALWWKRAAIGAAAAAAVVFGVIFTHDKADMLVPEVSERTMIAVAEPTDKPAYETDFESAFDSPAEYKVTAAAEKFIAYADIRETEDTVLNVMPKTAAESIKQTNVQTHTAGEPVTEEAYLPMDWDEETTPAKKKNVSFVISGIAGTNNTEGQNRLSPMKRPSLNPVPQKTRVEETSTKGSYGIPAAFGVGIKVDLNDKWSIGTGINYSLLSRQFYGKYTKVNTDGSIGNAISSDIRNLQHYVGIPVNAFYDIISNDNISFYTYAGGAVEKCVSDKYNVLSTTIVHKEKVSGVQVSANIGIGVEFMLGKHLGLYIDPSLRYYFNTGQPKSIRTVQPLMMGFEMGFRARL